VTLGADPQRESLVFVLPPKATPEPETTQMGPPAPKPSAAPEKKP